MDKHKFLKECFSKRTSILGLLFVIYMGGYIFFRGEHFFVHICYHIGGHKHYDGVRMNYPEAPAALFLDWWDIAFLLFIDTIYKPLMTLEAFLHSFNLLPSRCPWR